MSPDPRETDYDKQKKGGREKERADTYFIMGMGRGREEWCGPSGVCFFALLLDKLIRLADN